MEASVLVGFPCTSGHAYYRVTVTRAPDDPLVWDLRGAIERHIAASPFPLVRQLTERDWCIRPRIETPLSPFDVDDRVALLPPTVKLALIPQTHVKSWVFNGESLLYKYPNK